MVNGVLGNLWALTPLVVPTLLEMEIMDWNASEDFHKAQLIYSNLVGMDFSPKVANFDHKELYIAPTERYSDHKKVDFPPTKVGFDQGKVDTDYS